MFGHLPELFIILVIALVVFGPEKLPEVAANAGKMVREVRQIVDEAMHPHEPEAPDDFSTYYYESLAHSGEEEPHREEHEEPSVEDLHPVHYDWAPGADAGASTLATESESESSGAVALADEEKPLSPEGAAEPLVEAEKIASGEKPADKTS